LRDDTIKCTDWKVNTIYCYTLTGQEIWAFKDKAVVVAVMPVVVMSPLAIV
jgi:outer membrane protein assembly factor BamB